MNRYIEKKHVIHIFPLNYMPAASAGPGETLILEAYGCYTGRLLREESDFDHVDKSLANPAIRSVYIKGACPQDILRLTIRNIELGQVGVLDEGPMARALKEHFPKYIIRRLSVKGGMVHHEHLQISAHLMIGVIGTAPKGYAVSILVPRDHEGSMDCTSIGPDAIPYLPIRVPGTLLAMRDLHAVMGDGECRSYGVEIGGRATVQVDVVKNHPILQPLVEIEDRWIAVAFRENMDEACQKVVNQMFTFLIVKAEFSKPDAGIPVDMLGNLVVYQTIDPQRTVRLEMSKWPLEKLEFYRLANQESITRGLKEEQEVRL